MDLKWLKEWGDDALRVIFPKVCEVCGRSLTRGEELLCMHCYLDMPRTRLHQEQFNVIHQRLAGKAPIDRATGYFYYYRDSDYARLIQNAKYKNRPIIIEQLARMYVKELKSDKFFDDIDVIVPVPMHWFKKLRRGYNQSEILANALSDATGIKVCKSLVAKRGHKTQTRKGHFERWLNTKDLYDVKDASQLKGKHVLVVDDVITTGATILACCEAIHSQSPSTRISVLTLSVTHLQ
ncbi:MAG: ComF family protein [Muribaculaceae bacterium]|nr:ComF family protein [Muribaculaceae bacterium]